MKKRIMTIMAALLLILAVLPVMTTRVEAKGETKNLFLEASAKGKTELKLSWNQVSGADKYVVYGAKCGKKSEKIATVKKGTTYTVKKIGKTKLKAHTSYKLYVVAYSKGKKLIKSNASHVITTNTVGEYGNVKKISVKKKSITLKEGKSATIKPVVKIYGNKKHLPKGHGAATKFYSADKSVATVSSKGKVKGIKEGTTIIYVQDNGGKYCKVKVTVKGSATPTPTGEPTATPTPTGEPTATPTPVPTYTVTFDVQGHGTAPESISGLKSGDKITEPTAPTADGYTFGGWFKEDSCENVWNFASDAVTEATTLYAKWTANTYTVSFDANSGSGSMEPQSFTYDSAQSLSANTFTKNGYNFIGWDTDASATTASYSNGQEVKNLTADVDGTVTLYAIWTVKDNVTITYLSADVNKGTVFPASEAINPEIGDAQGSTATPVAGYHFVNWTNEAGIEVSTDAIFVPQKEAGLNVEATYTANFAGDEHYIIYRDKGNTDFSGTHGANYPTTHTNGTTTTLVAPSKTDYEFAGWFTEADCSGTAVTSLAATTAYTGDITLYAKWIRNVLRAVYDTTDEANILTFYYDDVDHSGAHKTVYEGDGTTGNYLFSTQKANQQDAAKWGYSGINTSVKKVVIDPNVAKYHGLTNTSYMFNWMSKANEISGAEYLDVSGVTNMSYMFYCFGKSSTEITSVPDVSEWDTSNVTDMTNMFYQYGGGSTSFNAVPDVSKWDTSNVTIMQAVFQEYGYNSTALTLVPNVEDWKTDSVTTMKSMFNGYGFNSLVMNVVPDVSAWNTSKVTDIGGVFKNYGNNSTELSTVPNVNGWDTSSVTWIASAFNSYGCMSTKLNFTLDLRTWNVSKITVATPYPYADVFNWAGNNATTWSVTIPAKTGATDNEADKWYVGDGTQYITPRSGKSFAVATP